MRFIDKYIRNIFRDEEYYVSATNFVNDKNLKSQTDYLIWVDLNNFKTNVFKEGSGKWILTHSYLCTTGKKSTPTPTPTDTFEVGIKGLFFGTENGYKCWYYTQFKGNYLFHSIIYNLNGSVRDGRLGMKLSNGCIRLKKYEAKWIYDYIPKGITVVIS